MGIFGDQAMRLLREKWGTRVDPFAEELFAIFRSEKPVQFDSPIQITNNTTEPAVTVNNNSTGDTIQVNNQPSPPIQFPQLPPVNIPDFPAIDQTIIINNIGNTSSGPSPQNQQPKNQDSSSTFPGKVLSGSGNTYSVRIYTKGINNAGTVVQVKQLQISNDETIPPDTWCLVAKVTYTKDQLTKQKITEYYMQVPVWL